MNQSNMLENDPTSIAPVSSKSTIASFVILFIIVLSIEFFALLSAKLWRKTVIRNKLGGANESPLLSLSFLLLVRN